MAILGRAARIGGIGVRIVLDNRTETPRTCVVFSIGVGKYELLVPDDVLVAVQEKDNPADVANFEPMDTTLTAEQVEKRARRPKK